MAEPLKTKAAPLTPEAVTEAVKEVSWWTLCWCLCAPDSKRYEIGDHYPPEDRRRVVVDWWFSTDPTPSWRRLISRLDLFNESETADKIRHNAEPVEDPTFTLSNVTTAVESVQDWNNLDNYLDVPSKRRGSREGMLQYFITTVPNASWQTLAGGLYHGQEQAALERVMKYFQRQPEATLTVANLCSVLEEVVDWHGLGHYLDVPGSIRNEIEKKYSDDAQRKQVMLEEWRNHHPAPSWMLVANALYSGYIGDVNGKHHKLLQVVKRKYLKAAALPEQPVDSTDSSSTTSASPRKKSEVDVSGVDDSPLDEEDFHDILSSTIDVAAKWKYIGDEFKLSPGTLETIRADCFDSKDCLREVILRWLRRSGYDYKQYGLPTWRWVVKVVGHPAGGDNPALARTIATKHPIGGLQSGVTQTPLATPTDITLQSPNQPSEFDSSFTAEQPINPKNETKKDCCCVVF